MDEERVCRSPEEMRDLGRELGASLAPPACLGLCGPLGAGKTQWVKGLAEGLGYAGEVTSPTFPLLHEYLGGRVPLFHLDFYRIENAAELLALGWDELLETGVVVAEWADKFPELLPPIARWIQITPTGEAERRVSVATGP